MVAKWLLCDLCDADEVDLKIQVSINIPKFFIWKIANKSRRNTHNIRKYYAIDGNRLLIKVLLEMMEVVKDC